LYSLLFSFYSTVTTEIYTLSLHDALPIFGLLGVFCTALSHFLLVSSLVALNARSAGIVIALEPLYAIVFAAILFSQYPSARALQIGRAPSELQSRENLVCRLLLEKKKKQK